MPIKFPDSDCGPNIHNEAFKILRSNRSQWDEDYIARRKRTNIVGTVGLGGIALAIILYSYAANIPPTPTTIPLIDYRAAMFGEDPNPPRLQWINGTPQPVTDQR